MLSRNEWTITGKILNITEKVRGSWVMLKGIAKSAEAFKTNNFRIDCWINKKLMNDIKLNLHKDVIVDGRFMFKKKCCYFVVERLRI